jgi:hypothetical protein
MFIIVFNDFVINKLFLFIRWYSITYNTCIIINYVDDITTNHIDI